MNTITYAPFLRFCIYLPEQNLTTKIALSYLDFLQSNFLIFYFFLICLNINSAKTLKKKRLALLTFILLNLDFTSSDFLSIHKL